MFSCSAKNEVKTFRFHRISCLLLKLVGVCSYCRKLIVKHAILIYIKLMAFESLRGKEALFNMVTHSSH